MCEVNDNFIEAIKNKNEAVFANFVSEYKSRIFHFIFKYVNVSDIAYELTQEVFIKIYINIDKYDSGKSSFNTWIYTIASNICKDHNRKYRLKNFLTLTSHDSKECSQEQEEFTAFNIEDDTLNPEQEIIKKQEADFLLLKIVDLPHNLKVTLILYYLEERSQKEVSEILGISPKAVETRIYRAKNLLKKKLKKF